MSLLVLGLSYRNAPLSLLEQLAVPAEQVSKALRSLSDREDITEAVVLSTCNRVEVYASVRRYHAGMADLRNFFSDWSGQPPEVFTDRTYDFHDDRAAAHLFSVTSGLESMVVGERQIQLQVKEAFRAAQEHGTAGRLLSALFRRALRVGRRARAETHISQGASSMVDVGLQAASGVLADLADKTVLVVGAGKMGGMSAGRLYGRAGRIIIANRSQEKRQRLADRVEGDELSFDELSAGLRHADLVISSTGAPQPLIDREMVADAMVARGRRPLVLLDLAVPRDVDPACAQLPGVTVLDVDALRSAVDSGPTGDEVAKAWALVEEEVAAFAAWRQAVRVEPTIAALRSRAEEVRTAELERLAARLSGLDERQREAVEALTQGIVNTLLHGPTVRLKQAADRADGQIHAAALRELFDLPPELG